MIEMKCDICYQTMPDSDHNHCLSCDMQANQVEDFEMQWGVSHSTNEYFVQYGPYDNAVCAGTFADQKRAGMYAAFLNYMSYDPDEILKENDDDKS